MQTENLAVKKTVMLSPGIGLRRILIEEQQFVAFEKQNFRFDGQKRVFAAWHARFRSVILFIPLSGVLLRF